MAQPEKFDFGNRVTITGTFKNSAGVPTDPPAAAVNFEVIDPSGTKTAETFSPGNIVNTGVGVYTIEVYLGEVGLWHYRWFSDESSNEVAEEDSFVCKDSQFD